MGMEREMDDFSQLGLVRRVSRLDYAICDLAAEYEGYDEDDEDYV